MDIQIKDLGPIPGTWQVDNVVAKALELFFVIPSWVWTGFPNILKLSLFSIDISSWEMLCDTTACLNWVWVKVGKSPLSIGYQFYFFPEKASTEFVAFSVSVKSVLFIFEKFLTISFPKVINCPSPRPLYPCPCPCLRPCYLYFYFMM